MKRPTQFDVARLAGVSRATVSYVINDVGESLVSEETRDRVLQAVEELGYQPNAMAQSFRSGTTRTIGMLIPDMDNPHYWQIAKGVEAEAQLQGYDLLLISSSLDVDRELHGLKSLTTRRIDGLVLILSFLDEESQEIQTLVNQRKPIVLMGASLDSGIDTLLLSEESGTQQIMEHLFALGHQNIGFIYGVAGDLVGVSRLETFKKMLQREEGIKEPERFVQFCGTSVDDAYNSALELFRREPRPTAVLVINDLLAIGVLRAAADLGLRVPEDISVASFDNTHLATYTTPRLTTVGMNAFNIGQAAAQMIFKRIEIPQLTDQQSIVIQSELFVRESTGPAPG